MPVILRKLLACGLLLWASLHAMSGVAQERGLQSITSAEVARGDWQTMRAPADGWQPVSIPDFINGRWPGFDGVVWYRLQWEQADAEQPTALTLEYINMAGAVYVNGILVGRDANLVEPLSRAWKTPRFFVLEPPVLKAGHNTLLIRVSGLTTYGPGIGEVSVGAVDAARALYEHYLARRVDGLRFVFAVDATLGVFFIMLWLMRRREVAFGWYGLSTLIWLGWQANFIVTSTWPFASNHTWAVINACFLPLFAGTFTMFVLRFCERRWPRAEFAMWVGIALGIAFLLLLPAAQSDGYRVQLIIASGLLATAANVLLLVLAWRGKRIEPRVLSVVALLNVLAAVHDILTLQRIVFLANDYYADATAFANTLGIAAVLAWRYARNLDRIEHFNVKLQHDVDAARSELADNLQRQHEVEMTHARIGERLNLVRDLHDGLGGSLTGSIAAIEHAPQKLSVPYLLKLLRDLRDELRLIVDTSAYDPQSSGSFGEQLVPLRHRMTRLLDAKGVVCRWSPAGLDTLHLPSAQALDVLRFLQEALTNSLKHSGATEVDVAVQYETGVLTVAVTDNGSGVGAEPSTGAGMQSMQARARRLGGEFHIESAPGRTRVAIHNALAGRLPVR
ncbi:sensor histidine kinase [Dokdonella soli]|uniref:histidine kinase n=1 Tax=Dokdonella soli TaxID=529810 RepID=A0ABN1IDZ3_9GAMM